MDDLNTQKVLDNLLKDNFNHKEEIYKPLKDYYEEVKTHNGTSFTQNK
jgi:hypothetical protein